MFDFHSGQIQLVFTKDDKLYDVFFVIQPSCRYFDDTHKDEVIASIDRKTPKKKIISLLSRASAVFFTIEHLSKLLTNKKFYSVSTNMYVWLRKGSLFTAFIINFLIFFLF